MSHHQHAKDATVEEKVGAVEIEKVDTLQQANLGNEVDEAVREEQLKIEKRAT